MIFFNSDLGGVETLLSLYLYLSIFVFLTSLVGLILMRHNFIVLLMAIELIFFSVFLNFVVFSCYLDDAFGQIFGVFILTAAAAESSIGLSLLILYYRSRNILATDLINFLKG
jgi:NADH-quinone oxidoreductase subunit K